MSRHEHMNRVLQGQVPINVTDTDETSQSGTEHSTGIFGNTHADDSVRKTPSVFEFSTSCSTLAERLAVDDEVKEKPKKELSTWQASVIIHTLTGITIMSCMSTGALTIALPVIARDLHLSDQFLLW